MGEPVVVQGRLKVRAEVRDGQRWTSADIDATAIGHDLARGTSAFRRAHRAETPSETPARPEPNWETAPTAQAAETRSEQRTATAGRNRLLVT